MKSVLLAFLLVAGFVFAAVTCTTAGDRESAPGLAGKLVDGVYVNRHFGLRLKKPPGWRWHDRKAGDSVYAPEEQQAVLLFYLTQRKTADGRVAAKFIGIAEAISGEIKDEVSYLRRLRRLMMRSNPPYEFAGSGVRKERIDKTEFSVLETRREIAGVRILQKFYIRRLKSHVLVLIAVYTDEAQWHSIRNNILTTILYKE